jgi:predicted nucleic acid-binding protein
MITAIDTNVLLDFLVPNEKFVDLSSQAVEEAAGQGSLVMCDLVYAELCVHFPTQVGCDRFVEDLEIRVEPLSRGASFLASRTWRTYRQRGGRRNRILTDFLIGAHAQVQASRLLTRDRGFYKGLFPSLVVVEPAAESKARK